MDVNGHILISEAYHAIAEQLNVDSAENKLALTKMLFEDLFAISNPLRTGTLNSEEWSRLRLAADRINAGEPLQYVTGISHFYGYVFDVDHRVLIPRSETEELVALMLQQIPEASVPTLKVLDIGTGSGCIAITLAKKRSCLQVIAIDVSAEALEVAQQNSQSLATEIEFICDDITKLSDPRLLHGVWDFIVSNPPYIQRSEQKFMDPKVLQYEPENALFPLGDDPLIMYQSIFTYCSGHLVGGGFGFLEMNEFLAEKIYSLALAEPLLENVTVFEDMQGKSRMLRFQRKNTPS